MRAARPSLKVLFVKISVDFNVTWGEAAAPDPIEIENVSLPGQDRAQRRPQLDGDVPLPIRAAPFRCARSNLTPEKIILHPFGVLAVSQKVVPLGYPLEKFGNKKPDVDRFELETAETGTEEQREEFAIAQFKKMSDADKLSQNSFDRLRSGLRFSTGDATVTGTTVLKEVTYELSYRAPQGGPARPALQNLLRRLQHVCAGRQHRQERVLRRRA